MNSEAFFTYNIKFPELKLVQFIAYTNNIQGWGQHDGTMGLADDTGGGKEVISTYTLLIYQL